MSGLHRTLSPEVHAIFEKEREIATQPAAVRTRALARARAALLAGNVSRPTPSLRPSRIRWTAAAVFVCLASAAAATAAYEIRARLERTQDAEPAALTRVKSAAAPVVRAREIAGLPPPPVHAAEAPRVQAARLSRADSARAELRLLRQARAAVAREDFAAALSPVAEHTRRFRDGELAEEREALRVKALAGLGRTEQARRAAAAFRARFPRSVLLPAVNQMPASQP
jgi:hypothetical protein